MTENPYIQLHKDLLEHANLITGQSPVEKANHRIRLAVADFYAVAIDAFEQAAAGDTERTQSLLAELKDRFDTLNGKNYSKNLGAFKHVLGTGMTGTIETVEMTLKTALERTEASAVAPEAQQPPQQEVSAGESPLVTQASFFHGQEGDSFLHPDKLKANPEESKKASRTKEERTLTARLKTTTEADQIIQRLQDAPVPSDLDELFARVTNLRIQAWNRRKTEEFAAADEVYRRYNEILKVARRSLKLQNPEILKSHLKALEKTEE